MHLWNSLRTRLVVIVPLLLVVSLSLAFFAYHIATAHQSTTLQNTSTPTVLPTHTAVVILSPSPSPLITPTLVPSPTPTPIPPLPLGPIRGVEGDLQTFYPGIPWMRYGYPTCGVTHLSGEALRNTIQAYHSRGIRVLLTTCQSANDAALFDPRPLQDVAMSGADAVQCGNEQMKSGPNNTYIPPDKFARYFDMCKRIVHAVHPNEPVLLGSLDPHVASVDYTQLNDQVGYLDAMQNAMNTSVHPGGNWNWRAETLGLIDSWHNGYPNQNTNNLYGLFVFWAQQFNVDLNSGALGKHIWVVEGTGCYKGCGIDQYNAYQVAVSHILTLVTDVQTALAYKIPFFYFAGKDISNPDGIGPVGVLDLNGHPKPLRQDLPMGARSLQMSCSSGQETVINQEQLLAALYNNCQPPNNYASILAT